MSFARFALMLWPEANLNTEKDALAWQVTLRKYGQLLIPVSFAFKPSQKHQARV